MRVAPVFFVGTVTVALLWTLTCHHGTPAWATLRDKSTADDNALRAYFSFVYPESAFDYEEMALYYGNLWFFYDVYITPPVKQARNTNFPSIDMPRQGFYRLPEINKTRGPPVLTPLSPSYPANWWKGDNPHPEVIVADAESMPALYLAPGSGVEYSVGQSHVSRNKTSAFVELCALADVDPLSRTRLKAEEIANTSARAVAEEMVGSSPASRSSMWDAPLLAVARELGLDTLQLASGGTNEEYIIVVVDRDPQSAMKRGLKRAKVHNL